MKVAAASGPRPDDFKEAKIQITNNRKQAYKTINEIPIVVRHAALFTIGSTDNDCVDYNTAQNSGHKILIQLFYSAF